MVVTNLLKNNKWSEFLQLLDADFPAINFVESDKSSWSPKTMSVTYSLRSSFELSAASLLHELGHMSAKHRDYACDVELLIMETEAWQNAINLAKKYEVTLDNDHIEDCLDTYRNWLHKRSMCPNCTMTGSQKHDSTYGCLNCLKEWKVSKSRFCRAYRMSN